ncbi:type II CRISPR RNA-guided endonuclease Cas9 [Dolosigranulum pigrum]|uniref:type II CRISPR RNA-guided endonuclease Cas9 n=1 Tax=Dolosigranulum pigrum TaxID=29394 RepID=UPI001AD87328|nr:type II CRISPR RNA-guided endonuclease Cas9 [Dolosigranulum pigrum]QTJ39557.1 type II CRISPR RNA-guided endonuclease Cas9 [Dolosigranulum pigrum]QTJ48048.1 type II CRISPR RNA-guided endonuclease Cas9 [Dolosigranulum pigrum]
MQKNYTIGLDIGTNSVGWAVMKDDYTLIRKRMKVLGNTDIKKIKKNFWGVRLFDEGETAKETRLKRGTRRRYQRRRNRLIYLQDIFQQPMLAIDENFFHRLDDSFFVPDDKSYDRHPIFGSLEEEVTYHNTYPTIYHLRKHLADNPEKVDLRLVYTALAHIVKYRGHFLIEGELNTENISIGETFEQFLDTYNEIFKTELTGEVDKVEDILKSKESRTQKYEQIIKLFPSENKTGMFGQFIKFIVGNKAKFKTIFDLEEDQDFQLPDENYEENLNELLAMTDDALLDVFMAAKNVYDAVEMSAIISTDTGNSKAVLSNQMINFYDEHKVDLAQLKQFFKTYLPDKYYECFSDSSKNGYAGYIDGKTNQENFYKYIEKVMKTVKSDEKDYFLDKIDREVFLRKQRSFYNSVIPHQIHLQEMQAILDHQSQYYSFLAENRDKIESLVTFRIPYYVGPLTASDQSEFAWMERQSDEPIRPWNFDEIVNKERSAEKFIERMTNMDTYLLEEKVLPKRSLLYQTFEVYNELTKVRYTNEQGKTEKLNRQQKTEIIETLFKQKNRVREKDIANYLEQYGYVDGTDIKGIEDKFNASLSTYNDLAKIDGAKAYLDDPEYADMWEDIIKILTVFEDKAMRKKQLQTYSDTLSPEILKKLERKHYTGWGRFSKKLINGLRDEGSNKTILDYLKSDEGSSGPTNRNFIQLIRDNTLSFKKKIEDARTIEDTTHIYDTVADLPGSPAIKKGIRQALKIVEEIIDIIGYEPENIVVEMARESQTTKKGKDLSKERLEKLTEAIKEFDGPTDIKVKDLKNENLRNDRLYLYYLQNGRDMYTNEPLDINNLSKYDIDHIIPQSFTTDNSIDNKVLVSRTKNQGNKSDDVPSINIVHKMKPFWRQLHKAGLISERKLKNLTKAEHGGLTEADKAHFLNRQLVETRQITKHVANLLDSQYNTAEEQRINIVLLKSSMTSRFRREFEMYKVREINDYHHAHDAYLNAVVAITIMKVYPNLKQQFVYGQYKKTSMFKEEKATARKYFYSNITKFFKKEKVVNEETGEILWDTEKHISIIKRVLSWKQMNIVKKVEKQKGQLWKETIHPKGDSDTLIPIKKGMDPQKYGGTNNISESYAVAIKQIVGKKKKIKSELVSIPIVDREKYEQNPINYLEKNGYNESVIIGEVFKYQLFELEDGTKRMIATAKEFQKANQLILPNYLVRLLYNAKRYDRVNHLESVEYIHSHISEFDDLFEHVINFAKKYIKPEKNIEKAIELYNKYGLKDPALVSESFINLMKFTSIGAPAEIEFFGEKIPRRQLKSITEFRGSTLIFQSITDLYETRYKLEDN